jgi:hypothetical protein
MGSIEKIWRRKLPTRGDRRVLKERVVAYIRTKAARLICVALIETAFERRVQLSPAQSD